MKLTLTQDQSIWAYEQMLLLRRFEEKCGQAYGMGQIGGFCHLYIGQEAIIVANALAKRPEDSTITSYRCHAHAIMSGETPERVLSELMGKRAGSSKGKGGSMHIFNTSGNYYGGHGIVGAQVSLGTGLAFANKYRGNQDICFTFMGDGAVNQGQVYESFNMASLWKLPVIYIIENNQYSMGTSVARSTSITDLYKKGISFGITGKAIDAMNVGDVYNAYMEASDFVRSGGGPIILEMKTYRYRGHSMSDPAKYRTKEEVDLYKAMDPIENLEKIILTNNYMNAEELKSVQNKIKSRIQQVVEFAQNAEEPCEEDLYTDVYI